MANHKSALKRIRANEEKRLRNRYQHKTMRNALRDVRKSTDAAVVKEQMPTVFSMIDKLVKTNIIHKNKAANLKSSISKHLNALAGA